ncbi:MAG: hypothetical protein H6657_21855 [Ardenticatenaceae bacterium]|nr:hypothetical protein [Ardenticatenaceae bacterium]
MENAKTLTPDAWKEMLADFIEDNRAEFESRFVLVLRSFLFDRRTSIRPNMLKGIAANEVELFAGFFRGKTFSAVEHGAELHELGLHELALLRLGKEARQFLLANFPPDQIAPALEAIDHYQEMIVQGYIYANERNILKEQEMIRGALQTAVGRYTVEIKEIEGMAEKAIQASQFKTQFIARIGHELRTPVGAMMGLAQMLQAEIYGPLSPQQKDLTQRIIHKSEVLKQVFAELLDQSQIESGQLRLKAAPFSPRDLVEQVHVNYLPLALGKSLSMRLMVDDTLPDTAVGDKSRLEQIITNLIVNAIKYTDEGNIWVGAFKSNATHWSVEVKDTGIGIAQEHLDYVFEPFRQTDESSGRQYGGVGLGLAIVQQLVKAMNGTVEVKSKLGQGSTFTVHLPLELTA